MAPAAFTIAVQRAVFAWEAHTGARPTKLLLGGREQKWLDDYVRGLPRFSTKCTGFKRPTFMGMDVYPVDDDKFMGVA